MRQSCGMVDFPYTGNCLSWVGRRGENVIRCRLDRSMGNEEWHDLFSHANMEYLRFMGSDHRPVLTFILSKKMFGTKNFDLINDGYPNRMLNMWSERVGQRLGISWFQ